MDYINFALKTKHLNISILFILIKLSQDRISEDKRLVLQSLTWRVKKMNMNVVNKFVGNEVEAEIKGEGTESFVVKGKLLWDDKELVDASPPNRQVTIAKEDEAISVDCMDILNLSLLKKED